MQGKLTAPVLAQGSGLLECIQGPEPSEAAKAGHGAQLSPVESSLEISRLHSMSTSMTSGIFPLSLFW